MKTQISKPVREKSQYSTEYKEEALALWRNSGRSTAKVAAQLGIRPPLLYRWARLARVSGGQAPTGKSPGNSKELEEENRRLREENTKLREQREVLKNHWASSANRRTEICPDRTNERLLQDRLAVRNSMGFPQRLLRLAQAPE